MSGSHVYVIHLLQLHRFLESLDGSTYTSVSLERSHSLMRCDLVILGFYFRVNVYVQHLSNEHIRFARDCFIITVFAKIELEVICLVTIDLEIQDMLCHE